MSPLDLELLAGAAPALGLEEGSERGGEDNLRGRAYRRQRAEGWRRIVHRWSPAVRPCRQLLRQGEELVQVGRRATVLCRRRVSRCGHASQPPPPNCPPRGQVAGLVWGRKGGGGLETADHYTIALLVAHRREFGAAGPAAAIEGRFSTAQLPTLSVPEGSKKVSVGETALQHPKRYRVVLLRRVLLDAVGQPDARSAEAGVVPRRL